MIEDTHTASVIACLCGQEPVRFDTTEHLGEGTAAGVRPFIGGRDTSTPRRPQDADHAP